MASASALPNLYQGVEKGSFGYKMLANMGWKEGQGLGANKQGIKEHVKVKKKQDALGVGAAEQAHKLRDWTTGMVGFDAILTGLKEINRQGRSSSSTSEGQSSGYDSDSGTTAEEVQANKLKDAANGNASKAVAGKKRRNSHTTDTDSKQKKNKKQKQDALAHEYKKVKQSSDGTPGASSSESDTDSGDGAGTATAPAVITKVSRVRAATHLARYRKREAAKTVRNYSATDLAAILGLPDTAPTAPNAEGAAGWAALAAVSNPTGAGAAADDGSGSSNSSSDSDDEGSSEQRLRPGTPLGSDPPPGRQMHQEQQAGSSPAAAAAGGEQEDDGDADNVPGGSTWWRSVFVRGGRSGASGGPSGKTRINISGFQEDDQANLYMQAHEAAVKNKQGLGRSAMPKKVAGARWQGKKTKLGSDDEDDEQQQQQQQQEGQEAQQQAEVVEQQRPDGREMFTRNGITIVMPLKAQGQQQTQQQQQQQVGAEQQQATARSAGKRKHGKKVAGVVKQAAAACPTASAVEAPPASASGSKDGKTFEQQQAGPSVNEAVASGPQKVRWAKLAAKILEGAPKKRMRVQKLHKKVLAAAGYVVDAPGVDSEALYKQMLKKLRKSEGLEVCEKYVAMA